jgi:hypothetical protein
VIRAKTFAAAIAVLGLLALFVPAGSQVPVIPSKEDRILEKLDTVLANQREMKTAIEKIAKALAEKERAGAKAAEGKR